MDVTVAFSGLCNFVPVYSVAGALVKVWTLLVNARDTGTVPGGNVVIGGKTVIHKHFAFLRFVAVYLNPNAPPEAYVLWPLHRCDLRLLDGAGNPLLGAGLALASPPLSDPTKPTNATELQSLAWLISSGKGEAKHARVDPNCVDTDRLRVPLDKVSARLEVVGGTFATKAVVTRDGVTGPIPITWWFEPPAPPPPPDNQKQALAEVVSLAVTSPTNDIRVSRMDRVTGVTQDLVLSQVAGTIELSIVNLEPESILVPSATRLAVARIEEFRWFYKLSADATSPFPIAVTDQVLGGNPYCPMSQSIV